MLSSRLNGLSARSRFEGGQLTGNTLAILPVLAKITLSSQHAIMILSHSKLKDLDFLQMLIRNRGINVTWYAIEFFGHLGTSVDLFIAAIGDLKA